MGTRVAIHQPNFLPWLGFFQKWVDSDVFVLLDDSQLSLKGGSWTNRTGILVSGKRHWLTVPVRRAGVGPQPVYSVSVMESNDWRRKALNTFHHSYSRAPFFGEAIEILKQLTSVPSDSLLEINVRGIEVTGDMLGLDKSKLVRSSSMEVDLTASERLVQLVKASGGDTYLSGDGAGGYQDNSLFVQNGLAIEFLRFTHPIYSQLGDSDFFPGLSVLDAIANIGCSKVAETLNGARGESG